MSEIAYTYHNYYADYQLLHGAIDIANETISSNSSAELASEVSSIYAEVVNCNLNEWDDSVGDGYRAIIEGCLDNLQKIIDSINGTFRKSEMAYASLKATLDVLQQADAAYKAKSLEKPIRENSKYWTTVLDTITIDGTANYTEKFLEEKYNADLDKWKGEMQKLYDEINGDGGYVSQIEEYLKELLACDNASIGLTKFYAMAGISLPSIFKGSKIPLPTNSRKDYYMSKYGGSTVDPHTMTINQNDSSDVIIATAEENGGIEKNLGTSGCGFVSAAVCASCALSDAYDTNCYMWPSAFARELEEKTDHSIRDYFNDNYDFNWMAFDDITETCTDISAIKIKAKDEKDTDPRFTAQSFKNIFDAGGVAEVSLDGLGHVASATQPGEKSGEVTLVDSGNPENTRAVVGAYDIIPRSVELQNEGVRGDISGKNGAIFIANKNLDIDANTGVIGGLDASGLKVESISICGKTYTAHTEGSNIVIDNPQELATDMAIQMTTEALGNYLG